MIAVLRRWWPVAGLTAIVALALLLPTAGSAQTPPPPPPPPDTLLGNPAGLTAGPGDRPGEVALLWKPAANAETHFLYLVETGGDDGRYAPALSGDAGSATIAGLKTGQTYWFIVIAGRSGDTYEWSEWSNWAQAAPRPVTPPPPPTPPATATPMPTPAATATPSPTPTATAMPAPRPRYDDAEIYGRVISIDADANTFTMRVIRHEHLRGNSPSSPVTVDYDAVAYIEYWLRSDDYIEAEGSYYPNENTLRAHDVELEYRSGRDDDDDDHDGDDYHDGDDD